MNLRRLGALGALALSTGLACGVATTATADAAVPTDSCYSFTVNPYGDIRPIISYAQQIQLTAKSNGVTVTFAGAAGNLGVACAPSSYTVYRTLKSLPVSDLKYTSVHSVADGTYTVSVTRLPDGMVTFPEREPYNLAVAAAEKAGLQVVPNATDSRTYITVKGNPAVVLVTFPKAFVRQIA